MDNINVHETSGLTPQSYSSIMEGGLVDTVKSYIVTLLIRCEEYRAYTFTGLISFVLMLTSLYFDIPGTLIFILLFMQYVLFLLNGTSFRKKVLRLLKEVVEELRYDDFSVGSLIYYGFASYNRIFQAIDFLYECHENMLVQIVSFWLTVCCTFLIATHNSYISYGIVMSVYIINGYFYYKRFCNKKQEKQQIAITNFIIKVANVIQLIRGASSKTDWLANLIIIYKQFDTSEILLLEKALDFVRGERETYTAAAYGVFPEEKVHDFMENLEERWQFFKTLKNSEMYESTKKFGMFLILSGCSKILGQEINESAAFEEIRKRGVKYINKQDADDLFIDIVDTTISMVKNWSVLVTSDDVYQALKSKDAVLNFVTEYEEVTHEFESKSISQIDQLEMEKRIRLLCAEGRRIKSGPFSNRISAMVKELKAHHRTLLVHMANNGIRELPFGVLLYGPSGVGKSYLSDVCGQLYLKYSQEAGYNQDLDGWIPSVCKYYRNVVDKYWSLYSGQWFVAIDDLAQERKKVLESTDNNSVKELILIMNNAPFATTQAEIDKKGTNPLLARCVVGTTNTKDLNAKYVFEHPEAALRRLPFVITVKVKDEFTEDEAQTLNSEMVHVNSWDFIIEKIALHEGKVFYNRLHVEPYLDMKGVQDFFAKVVPKHCKQQEELIKRFNSKLSFCVECDSIEGTCECMSDDTDSEYTAAANWYSNLKGHREYFEDFFSSNRTKKGIAIFGLLLTTLYIVKKTISAKSEYTAATDDVPNVNNPWFKQTDDLMAYVTQPSKCVRLIDLEMLLSRNIFNIKIDDGTMVFKLRALGICGRTVVTNKHVIDRFSAKAKLTITLTCGKQDQPLKDRTILYLTKDDITFGKGDLVYITHPEIREVKDIRKYLCKQVPNLAVGKYYSKKGEWVDVIKMEGASFIYKCSEAHYHSSFAATISSEESSGTCGAPLIAKVNGALVVVGISSAVGNKHKMNILGVHIPPEEVSLNSYISEGNYYYAAHENPLGEMVPVHPKSMVRHESLDGNAIPICSFTKARVQHTTRTRETPFAEEILTTCGMQPTHGAPNFKSTLHDGIYSSPELKSLEDRIHNVSKHDIGLLEQCCESLVKRFASIIDLSKVKPVDMQVAVNGVPGVKYIDPLNMASSGGFRFQGPKRKYFEGEVGFLVPNNDIMYWVNYIKHCARNSVRANVLFNATFKDEAISMKKINNGIVRTFFACPVDFILVMREQFLTLCAQMMEHNLELGMAAGLDCYKEWTDLYNHLNKFGTATTHGFAGDYAKYDAKMQVLRIHYGIKIMYTLCLLSGNFTLEDLQIQKLISAELEHPNVHFWGTFVKMFGTQISGSSITLILNCIINLLDMRYCYCKSTGKSPDNFDDDVVVAVMGDDNNGAVRSGVQFGHTTLMNELAKLDIPYTMADKSSESIMWQSLHNSDFLKRKFVYDEQHKLMLCPLDFKSIIKMLTTVTLSKAVPLEYQLGAILTTADREMVLHGREQHAQWRMVLLYLVDEYNLQRWVGNTIYWPYDAVLENILFSEKPIYHLDLKSIFEDDDYEAASRQVRNPIIAIINLLIYNTVHILISVVCGMIVAVILDHAVLLFLFLRWRFIRSPFVVLGVTASMSASEIAKAYRKLALIHHPDKCAGNGDKMIIINSAYEMVNSDEKLKHQKMLFQDLFYFKKALVNNPDGLV